ncbi:hypothetical protein CTAYLR_007051, partial [Chrysophaeum taylorii]
MTHSARRLGFGEEEEHEELMAMGTETMEAGWEVVDDNEEVADDEDDEDDEIEPLSEASTKGTLNKDGTLRTPRCAVSSGKYELAVVAAAGDYKLSATKNHTGKHETGERSAPIKNEFKRHPAMSSRSPAAARGPYPGACFAADPKPRAIPIRQWLVDTGLIHKDQFKLHKGNRNRRQLMRFVRLGDMVAYTDTMVDGRDLGALVSMLDMIGDHDPILLLHRTLEIGDSDTRIVVVVSTKNLLLNVGRRHNLSIGNLVCTDGTRRINAEGYPIINTGTVDIDQTYHMLTFTLAFTENIDIYGIVLGVTREAGVANGVVNHFDLGAVDLLNCYVHMTLANNKKRGLFDKTKPGHRFSDKKAQLEQISVVVVTIGGEYGLAKYEKKAGWISNGCCS